MNHNTKKKRDLIIDLKFKSTVLVILLLACLALSVGVYLVEKDAVDSTIKTLSDANWYFFGAMTTTGWGDLVVKTSAGKVITVIGYLLTRVSLLVIAYSAATGLAGFKNKAFMTVDDRLLVFENELKQLRSSVVGMGKDVNFAVKVANKDKNRRIEHVVKSVESMKDFVSSPVAKGVSVIADFSEEVLIESCENHSSIIAQCEQNGVSSITFSDKKIKF